MTTRAADVRAVPRRVTILGSTGSVGRNTVDLIEHRPERFVVEALTANRNARLLAEQAKRLRPGLAVVADPDSYDELKEALAGTGIEAAAGAAAVIEAASRPADLVMLAIVGAAGFEPTLAAARQGTIVALANKETLVCAGELVMATIEQYGATLLPVDSEHSAIFQVFDFEQSDQVERIILTASGGPFRTYEREAMAHVTRAEAVAHPNWDMGAKISVDSATMMNKGLEVVEAHHLFPVSEEQIEIVIHPESVVHSMVAYVDGSVLAQLGRPDMRTPIAYALSWPERMSTPAERLDFAKLGQLTFEPPDTERFPALRLAREALKCGGCVPTILNAANEVAVHGFLEDRIGFLDITSIVERALETAPQMKMSSVGDVREVDANAREIASDLVRSCTSSR